MDGTGGGNQKVKKKSLEAPKDTPPDAQKPSNEPEKGQ
jgi:hypothetical protein